MKKYLKFLTLFLLLFFSCKSIEYSSIFNKSSNNKEIIYKEISYKKNFQEELILKNNLKIILKESKIPDINISLYLKNPPLYQTQLNSGIEKIILSYIKNILQEKLKPKYKFDKRPEVKIITNKDFSSISINIKKEEFKNTINIISESLKPVMINTKDINNIKENQIQYLTKNLENPVYNLTNRFEKHIFRSTPLQISTDGNPVSLKSISVEEINKYYKNFLNSTRMLILINGNITKKDFMVKDFNNLEMLSLNYGNTLNYELISPNKFVNSPVYYNMQKPDTNAYFEILYNSPSFLDDDYFAYYIANLILKENFYNISLIDKEFIFSSEMINSINYGKILFQTNSKNIENILLSFKKNIDKTKSGAGIFHYYKDSTSDIIKDYKLQNENNIYSKNLSLILDDYKKIVFNKFDFSNIDSLEKEINFISIYFLLNDFIEPSIINERISKITENDILRIYDKYFSKLSWGIYSDEKILKGLSKDFF